MYRYISNIIPTVIVVINEYIIPRPFLAKIAPALRTT
jgi:hypothetical protein